jgi:hypothetical protein
MTSRIDARVAESPSAAHPELTPHAHAHDPHDPDTHRTDKHDRQVPAGGRESRCCG